MSREPGMYSRKDLELPARFSTRRLTLRPVVAADHAMHWALDSDPQVMRYVMEVATDHAAHQQRFEQALSENDRFKFLRTIELNDSPVAIGWVFLRPTEDGRWLELGYRLLPQAWGQGIVPEASRCFIEHAFSSWQALEVMALIVPANDKSRRVLQKLGFTSEGMTREFYDEELELLVLQSVDGRVAD